MLLASSTVFATEVVVIHKITNKKQEDSRLKLETIRDLVMVVESIKAGNFRLGNICFVDDIYFIENITHVIISCKKILP